MNFRIRRRWSVLLALLCGLAAGSRTAGAVECGEVLTEDTVLEADLLDCPGDGLIVGADGIRIDLGGHVLGGLDSSFNPGTIGIRNNGHDDVEIRNGRIQNFEEGVHLEGVTRNQLEALGIGSRSSTSCIVLVDSDRNDIRDTGMGCGDYGILLIASHGNRLESTRANLNDNGSALVRSDHNELVDNRFGGGEDHSLLLEHSDHNLVRGNRIGATYEASIRLSDSHDNQLIENTVMGGDEDGILLSSSHRNVIARNEVFGENFGLTLSSSHHNRIKSNVIDSFWTHVVYFVRSNHNWFTGNTIIGFSVSRCDSRPDNRWSGVRVFEGTSNRFAGNAVTENCLHGIDVDATSRNTLLLRNLVYNNGDDGIHVDDPTAKLVSNTALGNGDYGIEAVQRVRGGGNRAFHNGNPDQCLNTNCMQSRHTRSRGRSSMDSATARGSGIR
jgi:parallel beta-helix repeat protein